MDIIFLTRLNMVLRQLLGLSMASKFAENQLNARFNHSHYGVKPKHRCQQKLPLLRRDPLVPPVSSPVQPLPRSLCPGWG